MATDPKEDARQRYSQELREQDERLGSHIDRLVEIEKLFEESIRNRQPPSPPVAGGAVSGDNGDMEHRVTALETRLDTILPTLATKGDIGELRADFKGWTLTTSLTLAGTMLAGFIGIATLLMTSLKPPQASSQPIIINVPSASPAQPAASGK